MIYEWDENKRISNIAKHGLDFLDVGEIWTFPMVIIEDKRYDYGESRYIGYGLLNGRVVVCAFTMRGSLIIRVISLRKANQREIRLYEKVRQKKQ